MPARNKSQPLKRTADGMARTAKLTHDDASQQNSSQEVMDVDVDMNMGGSGSGVKVKKMRRDAELQPAKQQLEQDVQDEDNEEENDDEDNEEDDEEDEDMDGMDESDVDEKMDGKKVPQKESAKMSTSQLYAAPTTAEIHQLKETADLFQSNLFKMQIDELMKEVSLNTNKTGPLDKSLRKIKETIDSMKDIAELGIVDAIAKLNKNGIKIPFPHPAPNNDVKYKFAFQKPTKVFVAGSYILKTVTKSPKGINIDMVVQMPETLFTDKDHVNNRYFHKRAFYLAVIASALKDKKANKESGFKLTFETFNNDPRRPILIISPSGTGNDYDFSSLKTTIRILPSIPPTLFPSAKLAPSRNNVRPSEAQEATVALPPTPRYNTSLLSDTAYISHLNYIHAKSEACPSFKTGVMLGKVWCAQRGFDVKGFGGFLFTMIMGSLLKASSYGGIGKIRLGNGFSSYQLVKLTLEYLAKHDFTQEPLFMTENGKPLDDAEFSLDAFTKNFDVVMVDPSGRLNLAAFISKSTLDHIQFEARASFALFQDIKTDRFDALFLKNSIKSLGYFDSMIRINAPPANFLAYKPSVQLDFPSRNQFIHHFIPKLLNRGIKDRTQLITIEPLPNSSWTISESMPNLDAVFSPMTVGIVLNPETSIKIVEQGPASEEGDSKAINDFRRIWGSKSSLRRFNDGSIVESVVWETDGTLDQRSLITGQMAAYLISRHVGIKSDEVVCWGGQLSPFLKEMGGNYEVESHRRGTFQNALDAFSNFAKQIRSLDDIPLSITRVVPVHPGLRSTSVFIPQPHNVDTSITSTVPFIGPVLRDTLEVIIELESSLKWPQDPSAHLHMKLAFAIKIAKVFASTHPGTIPVVSKPTPESSDVHMDITADSGYTFRVFISTGIETHPTKAAPSTLLQYKHIPEHASRMQALTTRHPFMATTIRLLKRFVASHLLSDYFSDIVLELIVVKVFVDPAPYPSAPNSAMCGFMRTLEILSTWNWKNEAMDVEYEAGEMGMDIRAALLTKSEEARKQGSVMIVGTIEDGGKIWECGNAMVVPRLKVLAAASLRLLRGLIDAGTDREIAKLFVTPVDGYDMLIRLDPTKLPRYRQCISFDPDVLPQRKMKYKNLAPLSKDAVLQYLEEFDPVEAYLDELKNAFGDIASFFYDKYGGDTIAVMWNKKALCSQPFKVNASFNYIPETLEGANVSKKNHKPQIHPHLLGMAAEMERLGAGFIVGVDILTKS